MALLKAGTKYPLSVVSLFTYTCDTKDCNYSITITEDELMLNNKSDDIKRPKCPRCGLELSLVSIHADADIPKSNEKE